MFGKIISLIGNTIKVENASKIPDTNYIGFHVIFDEQNHKIVGEIVSITAEYVEIYLIGEISNGTFSNGVLKKPSYNAIPRIIYKSELESILGSQNYLEKKNLLFGSSPIYKDYVVTCDISGFFANHFAIIGNSGAGKSCGVARILQNVFYTSSTEIPANAHMCLFDAYGEYYNTFDDMDKVPNLHFKKYTTQLNFGNADLLTIPAYFLGVDDLAILLGASDPGQIPVLQKTLDLVRIFTSQDPKAEEYKNNIISKCILEILSSGKTASQLRDQIMSVLTSYHTPTINLESNIHQPGYDRTLRQCLNIDDQGKLNAVNLVVDFFQKHAHIDIEQIELNNENPYTLQDLYYALEFALINEGSLVSDLVFEKNNILKSRLSSIINSEKINYFSFNEYISKSDFVEQFFSTASGEPVQLVDINLSFIDDKFAKSLVKIYTKLFFDYTTTLENRGSYSIHVLLEEAHRYVQNDSDYHILGYNIFDRITKEGRKYGMILGFITQRPNELSKTALSQCSNFVVFRLFYPDDLQIVKGISSNVTDDTLEKIKTLHPGMGLVFGTAFKIPLLVQFTLPNPLPVSTSLQIESVWYN